MGTFDQISPIVLLCIFGAVFYFAGFTTALVVAGISGTISMVIGIIIRAGKLPKIDGNWQFHDSSSGVFIAKREGQLQYASIFCAVVGLIAFKSETLLQTFSFFTALPAEFQAGYGLVSHAIGYITAFD